MTPVPASASPDTDRQARRNVAVLAGATALAGANASVIFATGAIAGVQLAPDPSFATAPITVYVLGMAFGTLPIGYIARHLGRRTSLMVGAGFGAMCGLLACAAVLTGTFWLLLVATFCGGVYAAAAQAYRFAAADMASPAFRPRAISLVMAGGVLAGVVGPQLVTHTMDLWPPYLFAASYLGQAVVALLAMALLSFVDIPRLAGESAGGGRPLMEVARQPAFVVAAICGVVTYALMNFVMTAAPLAMRLCGHPITDSNLAIQWHVIAMYAPSFVTGSLIARFGAGRVVAAGLVLTAAAAVVGLMGQGVWHFWIALIVLGVGWNFGFIGASAMVTQTHRPEERTRVQSFNDFLIFGTMAVGSFSSGHILTEQGWNAVNLVVFPPVALALAMLVIRAMRRPRAA